LLLLDQPVPVSRLLEVHEVAILLKCNPETVLRLIRDRELAVIHLGKRSLRIHPADLQAFIDAQRVPPHPQDPPQALSTPLAHVPLGDRRQILGGRRSRPREDETPRRSGDVVG
jgi:excisionase family DNA binding protein